MKLLLILGNQLFPLKNLDQYKQDHIVFMSEDYELCSYEKHHKLKILLFLSCMRSYAESLKVNKFKIEYSRIDSTDFRKNYIEKLKRVISSKNIKEITCFENEDKFLEARGFDPSEVKGLVHSIVDTRRNILKDVLEEQSSKLGKK